MSAAILFGSMAVMIGFGIPIAIVLGVSSALTLIFSGAPLGVSPSMMQATVQKFSLLTIPLFVLAGAIMDKGGISKRLINLRTASSDRFTADWGMWQWWQPCSLQPSPDPAQQPLQPWDPS